MRVSRFLCLALLMTSAALLVGAEEGMVDPVDDVDRTDFTEEHLKEDPVSTAPMGPHSEVEPASLIPDLVNGKVPIGVESFVLCSLANLGGKMFNVSAIKGSLLDADGKVLQKYKRREYGEPLGPREQRSFRFGFTPDEATPPGDYKLHFEIFYNNRDKDQFNDTIFDEPTSLVPAPPSLDARLRLMQAGGAGVFVILMVIFITSRGKATVEQTKPAAKVKSSARSAVDKDEWLAATLAGTEGVQPKRKPKRS